MKCFVWIAVTSLWKVSLFVLFDGPHKSSKVPWWKRCRLGEKVGVSIHVKWGAKSMTQMGWLTRVFGD